MPAGQQPGGGKRNLIPGGFVPRVLVLAGIAYALVAASTTAFTRSANIVTAAPIVLLAVLAFLRWPLRPRPRPVPTEAEVGRGESRRLHPWRAWVILFAAVVVWELAEYAARGSRADHPTFSSMADAVDRYYVLKAIVFFLWLALGAAIVRRGARRSRPGPDDAAPVTGAGPVPGSEPS